MILSIQMYLKLDVINGKEKNFFEKMNNNNNNHYYNNNLK